MATTDKQPTPVQVPNPLTLTEDQAATADSRAELLVQLETIRKDFSNTTLEQRKQAKRLIAAINAKR